LGYDSRVIFINFEVKPWSEYFNAIWLADSPDLRGGLMIKRFVMLVFVVLLLAGCGRNTPEPTLEVAEVTATTRPTATPVPPTQTPTATPTKTATLTPTSPAMGYGPDNFPADVNPLTGQVVSSPQILDRRPVSVKIELFPRSNRPQWGLSLADIVYEYDQNSYLTRFDAIYYGNDTELAGPIRSARLLDASLVRMYKANFVFGLADERILTRLINSEFSERLIWEGREIGCPPTMLVPLCRYDPAGQRLLLTDTEMITQYVTHKGIENGRQDLDGMTFHVEPPEGGQEALEVYNRYSISSYNLWEYDPESGRYLRFQDTTEDTGQGEVYEPLTDRLNEEQLAADNIVIILVRHEYYWRSPNGLQEILDILLSGSGPAYAFRDGQMYEVQWNRPTLDSVLYLTFPDGSDYAFKPGTTWFQVHGETSIVKNEEDGSWRFQFQIP
jgi:hypothetical protein